MEQQKQTLLIELPAADLTEIVSINEICRICANQHDKLMGIYSEEGENNDLANKINSYLPIKVDNTDDLPLQCCWQCASTILAWHELVVTSIEADRRLRSYQFVTEKQIGSNTESHAQNNEDNDECKLQMLSQSEPISLEKPEISDLSTNNYEEYISLQQEYLPSLPPIYDSPNRSELELSETLSTEADIMQNKPYKDDINDPPAKDDPDKTCFGCQVCQIVFFSEEKMRQHMSENHPNDKDENDSEKSKNSTKKERKRNTKLNQEMVNAAKIVVDGKVYYNCKECGRCLYSPYTYVWHMRIHTGERPHACHKCGKCFRVSQGLIRHLRETHEGIKTFPCDICGRMFSTRRNAEEHRRIHTNERPYVCDLCGKSFKQKASLYVHNRSHFDVFPFVCSHCPQTFRTRPAMMVHITKHTGERPYACETCGRRFRIKYELKRHRLIHSDEMPFVCDLCGLRFKQKRYLRNHHKLNHTIN